MKKKYIIGFLLLSISCNLSSYTSPQRDYTNDDSIEYLVDYVEILGDDWRIDSIASEKNGDKIPVRLLLSNRESVFISAYNTSHKDNSLAFFRQWVFQVDSQSQATMMYAQEKRIRFNDYPQQVRLPQNISLFSDQHHIACNSEHNPIKCQALMQYENYIIRVLAFLVRDSTRYLEVDTFLEVIIFIDQEIENISINQRLSP